MNKIAVLEREIRLEKIALGDYISLTDIARYKDNDHSDDLIRNWVRNRNTVEFLGIWEHINNPDFNSVEFDGIRKLAVPDETLDRIQKDEYSGKRVIRIK